MSDTKSKLEIGNSSPDEIIILDENRDYVCSVQVKQIGGGAIAEAMEDGRRDNAKELIKRWNSHDQLLDACEKALKVEKIYFKVLKLHGLVSSLDEGTYKLISDWYANTEAAIALAKG